MSEASAALATFLAAAEPDDADLRAPQYPARRRSLGNGWTPDLGVGFDRPLVVLH